MHWQESDCMGGRGAQRQCFHCLPTWTDLPTRAAKERGPGRLCVVWVCACRMVPGVVPPCAFASTGSSFCTRIERARKAETMPPTALPLCFPSLVRGLRRACSARVPFICRHLAGIALRGCRTERMKHFDAVHRQGDSSLSARRRCFLFQAQGLRLRDFFFFF